MRPTISADFWPLSNLSQAIDPTFLQFKGVEVSSIKDVDFLAGRDCQHFGTWLGMSKQGLFGTLTNLWRTDRSKGDNAPTRGRFITSYASELFGRDPLEFLKMVQVDSQKYNGFNLILIDLLNVTKQSKENSKPCAYFLDNFNNEIVELKAGVHGISNSSIKKEWPKITAGKKAFEKIIQSNEFKDKFELIENLRLVMSDSEVRPDPSIADNFSSIFVNTTDKGKPYGTCSQIFVLVDWENNVTFLQRNQSLETGDWTEKLFEFTIQH